MNRITKFHFLYNEAYTIYSGLGFEIKPPKDDNKLTQKLKVALEEVAKIERGELKATNARDFLEED